MAGRNGKDGDTIVLGHIERHLTCKLTPEEVEAYGRKVGVISGKLREQEAKFDAAKEDHKGKVKGYEAQISTMHRALESGTESRPVRCAEVYNPASDRVDIIRMDTEVVVDRRPLTQQERQGEMFKRPRPEAAAGAEA